MFDINKVFVESNRDGYPVTIFNDSELNFITSKNLVDIRGDRFFVKFVGEFITPDNTFFSLPKNFQVTEDNVNLFKKVLLRYKDIKGEDGKTLITNNSFSVKSTGEYNSEKFYYNELKEFFLDYITYEFIYPYKKKKIHSSSPIPGKIDVFATERTRKIKGPGITYKVKDIQTKDWNLDDIYWTTLMDLQNKYGTQDDLERINELKDFLLDQGYNLETVDLSNTNKVINDIMNCEVGIIHTPIKNTLIDYYNSKSIGESFKINAFYTDKFQYVWERIAQLALKDNQGFRQELEDKFKRPEIRRKWFPNQASLNRFLSSNLSRINSQEQVPSNNGIKLEYELKVVSLPDIFSSYAGKKFIGDAKYYKDPENATYDKEFYTYNYLMDNKYPMVVIVPGARTRPIDYRSNDDLEISIFKVSVQEVIDDDINGTDITIKKIHTFLFLKGYTNRMGNT